MTDSRWPKHPIKHVAFVNARTLRENEDPQLVFRYLDISAVGRGVLVQAPVEVTFEDAPSRARRLVQPGDTIVSTVRTYLRAVWPVSGAVDDLVVSTGFAVLTPGPAVDHRYLGWWAQGDPFVQGISARSVGVSYPAINAAEIGNLTIPLPPPDEQRRICAYLDAETARIDGLVASKQRLMKMLIERLRLLALQSTTGTSARSPLRRHTIQVKTGTTPPADQRELFDAGIVPWYSPGDVGEWLELLPPSRRLATEPLANGWVPVFPPESTLLVGIGATAGRIAHLDHYATGNQQMTCIVAASTLVPRFLSWQLFARCDELRATAPFTTLPILNNDFLKVLLIDVPTLSVQHAVVSHLDSVAENTRRVIEALTDQMALLIEHRQALITAAVTGELEVAGAAA